MAGGLELIDTIVYVMMENRSFDHVLGHLSAPPVNRTDVDGIHEDPAWMAQHVNRDSIGNAFSPALLTDPSHPLAADPPHERSDIALQIGSSTSTQPSGSYPMDGFIKSCGGLAETGEPLVMGYYDGQDVFAASFFAENFGICNRWFSALPAGTQPNRLMAFGGTSTIDVNSKFLLPKQDLVYDWLNRKGIRWRVYHNGIPFFTLMEGWQEDILLGKNFSGYDNFRCDNKKESSATYPQVIFIEPRFTSGPHILPANDEHAPSPITPGQRFLLQVYSDLLANRDRWARTLMIVTYDEHGGFYDHVSPLPTNPTAGGAYAPFMSTGVRVPAFLVSPLIPPGSVFQENVDHTGVLKLLANKFVPGQGYSPDVDNREIAGQPVADLSAALTLSAPRTDLPFPAAMLGAAMPDQTQHDPTFFALKEGLDRMRAANVDATEAKFSDAASFYGPDDSVGK
jgi:phospholipase C